MLTLIEIALGLAALYAGSAWALLAYRTFAKREDWENETFHLGLCFVIAVGFLGLLVR